MRKRSAKVAPSLFAIDEELCENDDESGNTTLDSGNVSPISSDTHVSIFQDRVNQLEDEIKKLKAINIQQALKLQISELEGPTSERIKDSLRERKPGPVIPYFVKQWLIWTYTSETSQNLNAVLGKGW